MNLVLADDHPLFLDGVERLLSLTPGFRVVARCSSGVEALRDTRQLRPDILLLDLNLPEMSGLHVLRNLRDDNLPTRVVLLTGCISAQEAAQALRNDARGIILKESAPSVLVECVRKVHRGGTWLCDVPVAHVLESLLGLEADARRANSLLSPRELDVVRLVAGGLRNKDIARKLFISEATVKVHVHHVYEKLGVDNRVDLATWARDRGVM